MPFTNIVDLLYFRSRKTSAEFLQANLKTIFFLVKNTKKANDRLLSSLFGPEPQFDLRKQIFL